MTSAYRIVAPDWALNERGKAGDVLAVEHVRLDRTYPCLVMSTTLDLWVNDLAQIIERHERECT